MSSTMIDFAAAIGHAYRRIAPCFGRSETRVRFPRYLVGLLSRTAPKN